MDSKPVEIRLFVVLLDVSGKGVDVLLQHLLQRLLGELALVVEGFADAVQINSGPCVGARRVAGQDALQMFLAAG